MKCLKNVRQCNLLVTAAYRVGRTHRVPVSLARPARSAIKVNLESIDRRPTSWHVVPDDEIDGVESISATVCLMSHWNNPLFPVRVSPSLVFCHTPPQTAKLDVIADEHYLHRVVRSM